MGQLQARETDTELQVTLTKEEAQAVLGAVLFRCGPYGTRTLDERDRDALLCAADRLGCVLGYSFLRVGRGR